MQALNFPEFHFRFSHENGKEKIFDVVRKKYISLTPEEWVRQNMIAFLVNIKLVPSSLIGVEKQLLLNGLIKRFDIAVFNRSGLPVLLVECKAPSISITEKTFDQAARYNMQLKVNYFVITNGIDHYCCRIDYVNSSYVFIEEIPMFSELI
jgi:hypothetical protein